LASHGHFHPGKRKRRRRQLIARTRPSRNQPCRQSLQGGSTEDGDSRRHRDLLRTNIGKQYSSGSPLQRIESKTIRGFRSSGAGSLSRDSSDFSARRIAQPQTRRLLAADLAPSYSLRATVNVEHQLPHNIKLNVGYSHSQTLRTQRTVNIMRRWRVRTIPPGQRAACARWEMPRGTCSRLYRAGDRHTTRSTWD